MYSENDSTSQSEKEYKANFCVILWAKVREVAVASDLGSVWSVKKRFFIGHRKNVDDEIIFCMTATYNLTSLITWSRSRACLSPKILRSDIYWDLKTNLTVKIMKEPRERKINRKMQAYYFQRRVLFGCTVGLIVAFILWIIAISSNRWYIVTGGKGEFEPELRWDSCWKNSACDRVNVHDEISKNISD